MDKQIKHAMEVLPYESVIIVWKVKDLLKLPKVPLTAENGYMLLVLCWILQDHNHQTNLSGLNAKDCTNQCPIDDHGPVLGVTTISYTGYTGFASLM